MNKYVIYTVIVGDYDEIKQPLVIDDRFDYILFSDQHIGETIGVWQIRGFKCVETDFVRVSRYPKILPHKVLPGYLASLYHDANISIMTRAVYDRIVELSEQKIIWAGMNHPYHDCIYDELYLISNLGFEHDYVAINWEYKLLQEGMPHHAGFFENNIIFRTHTKQSEEICERWWSLVCQVSRRDQFTLRYVLWKCSVPMIYFFPREQTPRNSPNFRYEAHNEVSSKKMINISLGEHIRRKIRVDAVDKEDLFKSQYEMFCKLNAPIMGLYLWGGSIWS